MRIMFRFFQEWWRIYIHTCTGVYIYIDVYILKLGEVIQFLSFGCWEERNKKEGEKIDFVEFIFPYKLDFETM